MEKVNFYIDYCFEYGVEGYAPNLSGRYVFTINLPEVEYQELYQLWSEQEQVNSWGCDWAGHDALFNKINGAATFFLNKVQKENSSFPVDSIDVLWELSGETENVFENLQSSNV